MNTTSIKIDPDDQFLRIHSVSSLVGAGKSFIYDPKNDFPKPIKLSPRFSVWSKNAVLAWMRRRVEAATSKSEAA